ncbi:MAG: type II secretion system secretin GspD [Gammaproteobacteria bacterium]|nr:type II secretion system secretin GspD [Gammaproteobacteria bacterium]
MVNRMQFFFLLSRLKRHYQSGFYVLISLLSILGWVSVGFAETPLIDTQPAEPALITTTTTTTSPNRMGPRLWNLQDADILSVINEVSQETGKNFVVDPRVSGKISLISSKPIKSREVYQVFLSVIGMLGYSAVPSGSVIKIVPNMESGEQATPVVQSRYPSRGEEVVVRVIPLENTSATQLIPILRPLLPQWSNVATYAPGNVLILLGRANNLERIMQIIQDVDRASNSSIQIVPLKRASAVQVAAVLNNLQNAARASGDTPGVTIAVDERSNSILLGGPRAMRLRIRILISQLDSSSSTPSGNTEVIYLRYLQAKNLAPLLGKIAQNIAGKDNAASYDTSSAMTQAVNGNATTTTSVKETTINSSFIQAEPSTNAIIITAPPALMQAIKTVIAKLDIRPAEVLVEAIIAEIEERNLRSLGIQWGSVGPTGKVIPQGGEGESVTSFPTLGAGIIGIKPHASLKVVLSLLENLNGVDILSTPSIVVLDNQPASIEIGQDVPYQIGSYTTPTGGNNATVQPFNTFQSKPVTLKLEVKPQINLSNSVRLAIKLKNDSLQNPQNPGTSPIINTSKISNSVLVNSEDILVLGGLTSNNNNESVNKVPFFGDLPILGRFFQQRTRNVAKKTLMVFIKTIIIHNSQDANVITHVKYNSVRETQANFREDLIHIGKERAPTLLPPWKNSDDLPVPFEKKLNCNTINCD